MRVEIVSGFSLVDSQNPPPNKLFTIPYNYSVCGCEPATLLSNHEHFKPSTHRRLGLGCVSLLSYNKHSACLRSWFVQTRVSAPTRLSEPSLPILERVLRCLQRDDKLEHEAHHSMRRRLSDSMLNHTTSWVFLPRATKPSNFAMSGQTAFVLW